MARSETNTKSKKQSIEGAVTLKSLAAHLNLDPSTVSVVLNNVPGRSIPANTRERIWEAARAFCYTPNSLARSLRTKKTRTVGILLPDITSNDHAEVLSGITQHLAHFDYCCIVLPHGREESLLSAHIDTISSRSVEGLIFIDTVTEHNVQLPSVCIGGSGHPFGTEIQIDPHRAITLLLGFAISQGVRAVLMVETDATQEHWGMSQRSIAEEVGTSLGLRLGYMKTRHLDGSGIYKVPSLFEGPVLLDRSEAVIALDAEAAGAASVLLSQPYSHSSWAPWVLHLHTANSAAGKAVTATVRRSSRSVAQMAAEVLLRKLSHQHDSPARILIEPELVVQEVTT